jgi:aspartate aminotransferase
VTRAPEISSHFQGRSPSAIRQAQILFAQRPDREQVSVINLAIGNVSLPMHPAMRARMEGLGGPGSPFVDGVVKYSATVGTAAAQAAFLNIISSTGGAIDGLRAVVTDGGSMAMELMILGVCGPGSERPLLLLDPAYSNYIDIARRCCVRTVSMRRELGADGAFTTPRCDELAAVFERERPAALVVIPADNPTGQLISQAALVALARCCVAHGVWLVSDEAYRQLQYGDSAEGVTSVWRITEEQVPGIRGARMSIESASKVWNACGLRIGALVTDHVELHTRAVAEYTANLCSNVIGQHIFAALGELSAEELHSWYRGQRAYYEAMMTEVSNGLRAEVEGLIVTRPEASLYAVLDLRELVEPGFSALEFIGFCARRGRVALEDGDHTLLLAPMQGFYSDVEGSDHPGASQMRLAFVAPPEQMRKVPVLFARLLAAYLNEG